MKLKELGRKLLCVFAGMFGLMFSGCTKAKYTWSTEEEYFKVPLWKQHVRSFKKIKAKPNTVTLFIGDSITEGFDLKKHFNADSLENMGISGDFTSGILKRLDVVEKLQPKKIFIMIGINDILKDVPMERIKSQYSEILDFFKHRCSQAQVYVQTNLPTTNMGGNDTTNFDVIRKVRDLNIFLGKICFENSISLVNLYPSFEFPENHINEDYTYDGLHLNEEGYKAWSQIIEHLVQE